MAQIQYSSEIDKVVTVYKYRPIIEDMSKNQLLFLIIFLLNGGDVHYGIDLAMSQPQED